MSRYGDGADITGSLIVDGEVELGDGDDDIIMDGDDMTLVVDAGNNRVGILTEDPDYALHVAGDMSVDQYIYHNGDADTLISFTDNKIVFKAGNLALATLEKKGSAPHEVTINDGANNVDFVVKGNGSNAGNPGMNFDASTNRLGINGVGSPSYELDVAGDIGLSEYIYHKGDDDTFIRFETDQITAKAGNVAFINITEDDSQDKISFNEGRVDVDFIVRSPDNALAIYLNAGNEVLHINHNETAFKTKIHSTNGEAITVDNNGVVLNEDGTAANDFRVESDNDTHLLFTDAANDRIGIGTSSPDGLLHISTATTDATLIIEADTDNNNEGDNPIIILRQDGGLVDSAIYHATSPSNNDLHIASAINMVFSTSTNGRYASATPKMAITDTGEVGIGTIDPDEDAILELSSSDQGFMLPRVLSGNKPTAAAALNGLMLYEEDTHRLKIVANGEWKTITFEE
jgi:hypothetical protein